VNWYRSFGGRLRDRAPLPGLAPSPTLQASASNVVDYLAGLAAQGINACTHGQVAGHPWAPGEDHTHNVLACGEPSLSKAVDDWMATPFHGWFLVDPRHTSIGAADAGAYDAAGFDGTTDPGEVWTWPVAGGIVPGTTYAGGESPDPLSRCGLTSAGFPVYWFGPDDARIDAVSMQGTSVCALDTHGSPGIGSTGGRLILLPASPLQPGRSYTASVQWTDTSTGASTTSTWSFSAVTGADAIAPAGFAPVAPSRLLDTRDGTGGIQGPLQAGTSYPVQVTGRGGVPADASAVTVNVTVADPAGPGYVTVFPCGAERPNASTVNYVGGQTVPNAALVALSGDGRLCVYSMTPTQVVIDVTGAFTPKGATGFHPTVPTRVLDTRSGLGGAGRPPAGGTVRVGLAAGGVPKGASAVSLNVTAVGADTNGYVTAYACDQAKPLASSLNPAAGDVRSNLVTVPVAADGTVCLYTTTGVDLVADLSGWWGAGGDHLAPLMPMRVLDTRTSHPLGVGVTLRLPLAGSVPPGAVALAVNVTVTEPDRPGFVTAWPCDAERPIASTVNFGASQTVPNAAAVRLSAGQDLCLYTIATTHLVVDVAGAWF
jgi:hypothetical protein